MNNVKMNTLIQEMQSIANAAKQVESQEVNKTQGADFAELLKTSINNVNDMQKTGGGMAKEYELGNKDIELADVMLQMQKANVSFQAMTQVRNKLITAYQEIMNMQV